MIRLLIAAVLGAALLNFAPAAHADPFCIDEGATPGSASKPFDGGTVWISPDGLVGVTTGGGTNRIRVPNAGPMPLQAMVMDAQGGGYRQLIVSNGRVARLYVLDDCKISNLAFDVPAGESIVQITLRDPKGKPLAAWSFA